MKRLSILYQRLKNKLSVILYDILFSNKRDDILVLTSELDGLKLNLGCGNLYKNDWINIDIDKTVRTDICSDFMSFHNNFKRQSVKAISMIHSISYLNLWEARLFFKNVNDLLINGGVLELEFPDAVKCSMVLARTKNPKKYIEAVRGLYAFDLEQVNNMVNYEPYSFGWTAWFIQLELESAGFRIIKVLRPLTHGKKNWRDIRIIAVK